MLSYLSNLPDDLSGHLWTVGPKLKHALVDRKPPPSRAWRRRVGQWDGEPVYVTGRYRARPEADTLVVVVHGLGGCTDSDYAVGAARQIERAGHASLRLALRGADRSGDDLYHGGLYQDVAAAVTDPTFACYERIFVVGYSLGGHIALRAALEVDAPRLAGVAAVCSPLDLGRAQQAIDAPSRRPYRMYLLHELRQMYRTLARRHTPPTPVARVERAQTLREWDALTVVPRFGFRNVDDYYRTASVGGRLDRLERPALLVAARHDPLIFPDAIESAAPPNASNFEINWVHRGGHVFFPADLDLGYGGPRGLVPQILTWLEHRA